MTAPLTDRERAMCREAAVRAIRAERRARASGAPPMPPEEMVDLVILLDPAPASETVTLSGGYQYRMQDGELQVRFPGTDSWGKSGFVIDDIRALTSFLPRRELTDEIVRRATDVFWRHLAVKYPGSMRAALLAVWDDIAGPAAPALKPQWWGVVDNRGRMYHCPEPDRAPGVAKEWDRLYPDNVPHRVVALAEVPHVAP